ncbi:MAG: hypothetical protein Q9223_002650 [Gallowayella weberi]
MTGSKSHLIALSLALGLMLAIIETSITATALVTIGEYFQDSVTVTWVVLAYLLSYMGFAVIFTRLSDGIGREAAVVLAYLLFAAFSLGAGRARTLNQLIALRAFQGIGGSGLYSMIMVVGVEVTPPKYRGALSGIIGMTLAIGSVLGDSIPAYKSDTANTTAVGPILGGVITEQASWRWIYLFNAPAAVIGIVILLLSWPRTDRSFRIANLSLQSLLRVDWLGAFLLLAASTLLVFGLQQGCGLLSTLDGGRDFYSPTYGYEFILGLGVGLTFSSSTLLASLTSKPQDIAAAQGALSQARILGGSIGLAMATVVLNNRISDNLTGVVDPLEIKAIQQSVNAVVALSPTNRALVSRAYSDAFNEQMRICAYLSAAGLLISLATYQKAPPSVAAMTEKRKMREENRIYQASTEQGPGIEIKGSIGGSK